MSILTGTVGSKKTLTKVPFGTVQYSVKVRLRYWYLTVVVLFRYCAVNVQVRCKFGANSVRSSVQVRCEFSGSLGESSVQFGNRSVLVRWKLVTAFTCKLRNVNLTCSFPGPYQEYTYVYVLYSQARAFHTLTGVGLREDRTLRSRYAQCWRSYSQQGRLVSFLRGCWNVFAKPHSLPYVHITRLYSRTVFYLVSWVEEEAVRVVSSKEVVNNSEGLLLPETMCQVRTGGKLYDAKVVACFLFTISNTSAVISLHLPEPGFLWIVPWFSYRLRNFYTPTLLASIPSSLSFRVIVPGLIPFNQ